MKTQNTKMKRFTLIGKLIKCNSLLLFIFFHSTFLQAQFPGIEWQQAYGGTSYDQGVHTAITVDGGYIMACHSASLVTGNKTVVPFGGGDYWIIKSDNLGNIEWQKAYGGTDIDSPKYIEQTTDGGYIVGGYSSSLPGGNKTSPNYGMQDCWVLKLDAEGNIEWQNSFGGLATEYLYKIHQTSDGGYILGAYTVSGISGNKTEASKGAADYWMIKLDADGNKLWEKVIGGSAIDVFADLNITDDGGFIVGGTSNSSISGDKTENPIGEFDFWILKLDSVGNIEWQNTIGGSIDDELYFCKQTSDGGYFIGGYSNSPISGDKSEPTFGADLEYYDYWVIKLKQNGDFYWENTIGGNKHEVCYNGIELADGTLVIGGYSTSNISGDKTEPRFGGPDIPDIWIVALETAGDIIWQSVIGGIQYDRGNSFTPTPDGGFIISAESSSGISGNKTMPSFGLSDAWIIKINGVCNPTPELCNTLDDNCNGLIDDDVVETINITAAGPTEFCQGGSVSLSATYSGASLQWQKNGVDIPGATLAAYTAATKGNYACVTTSDCGTAISETIFVNVFKNPKAIISAAGPTTFCVGGNVTLNVSPVAGCSYQWYKDASPIPGATATNYLATTAGIYKCRVTKIVTGCFKTSSGIIVTVPCKEGLPDDAAGEVITAKQILVYPNPTDEILFIELPGNTNALITIYNNLGQQVQQQICYNEMAEIVVEQLPAGIYFIELQHYNTNQTLSFCKQ